MGADQVTILLALHQGARHILDQLDSFAVQDHPDWRLTVSDDISTDRGPELVRDWAARHPDRHIDLIGGPGRGFAANFLHLLAHADGPLVALSDQDDVWLPDKLTRAVAALRALPDGQPALYCARTVICDQTLRPLAQSPRWHRGFSFANALVQNVAAGNTIVLNAAALDLARRAAPAASGIVAHDWWLYQIVTGAGGRVIRDDRPVLFYRQHAANRMGRNDTLRGAAGRLSRLMSGEFRDWTDRHCAALLAAADLLTPQNRARLDAFMAARRATGLRRLARLREAGIYRQTTAATTALWLAAALGRF